MFEYTAYAKTFDELVFNINRTIINPLIQFAFIVAFVIFIWGVMEFIRNANNPTKREEGQQHMIWGIVGLAIMVGVYGIMSLLINTFGLSKKHILNTKEQTFIPPDIKPLNINK